MKFIAVILSIYVMGLTALPCAAHQAADSNSVSLEFSEQIQSHSNEVDELCSPFCVCNYCQTNFQPTIYNTFQVNLEGLNFTSPSIVQNEIKGVNSFWHPPQI